MKILCVVMELKKIYKNISCKSKNFYHFNKKGLQKIFKLKPDIILFYG